MSRTPQRLLSLLVLCLSLCLMSGCDSGSVAGDGTADPTGNDWGSTDVTGDGADGASGTGTDGPLSACLYAYGSTELERDFGKACTESTECAHGACIMPGDEGNITNAVFGFCSRGCDCDDNADASLPSEDADFHCVYPGGCFVGESQGAWRYAVPRCSNVDDCTAIDARYTHCETTNSKTVVEDSCGSLKKVCQAHAE